MLAIAAAAGSLRPDPGRARVWLDEELRRPEYHQQSLAERLQSWLLELWHRLTDSALHASSLSTATAVVLAVALVVLVVLVAGRVRVETAARLPDDGVLGPDARSADEHRATALAAAAEGRYGEAVVEAFRAVAGRSLDRGLLDDRPGLTAHEIAEAVSPAAPEHRGHLVAGAATFEAVFYGGRAASASQAQEILALDEVLRLLEPVRQPGSLAPGSAAVPR